MIRVELWGDYACFSRPDLKTERVSYDVMTPSAARGILDAIYWRPGVTWNILSIKVCEPIEFMALCRYEVKSCISRLSSDVIASKELQNGNFYLSTKAERQQRSSMILKNVRYIVDAYFTMDDECVDKDNSGKIQDIMTRRIRKGQGGKRPYFGCREFAAMFATPRTDYVCPESLRGDIDLGVMFYDFDYSDEKNIRPMFFRAVMKNGVIRVPARDSKEVLR